MRALSHVVGAGVLYVATATVANAAPSDTLAAAQSLAAAEQRLGGGHPDLLTSLGRLAELRFRDGETGEALSLRRRGLKIAVAAFGSDSLPAADAMTALASVYIDLRRYLDAEPLLIIAGSVITDRGAAGPVMASVLSDLARIALARGERHLARQRVEEAISLDEKNPCDDRSRSLRALGAVLAAERRYDDSARVLREALACDREAGDEPAAARSLAQLANTLLRQKRPAQALPLIEEAAEIDQRRLGATHPMIVDDLYTLGLVYLDVKRAPDAQKALQAALNLLGRAPGRDRPRIAYIQLALARAVHDQGRQQEAAALFAAARRVLNTAEEQEHEREREA